MNSEHITFMRPSINELPAAVKGLMRIVWFDTYTKFYSREVVEKVIEDQTLEWLQEQLVNPKIVFIIAKTDQNNIVGVVTSKRKTQELVKGIRLYVHPKYRSQGIGSALVGESLKYYSGVKVIQIHVK